MAKITTEPFVLTGQITFTITKDGDTYASAVITDSNGAEWIGFGEAFLTDEDEYDEIIGKNIASSRAFIDAIGSITEYEQSRCKPRAKKQVEPAKPAEGKNAIKANVTFDPTYGYRLVTDAGKSKPQSKLIQTAASFNAVREDHIKRCGVCRDVCRDDTAKSAR